MASLQRMCKRCIRRNGAENVACVRLGVWRDGADWRYLDVDNCPKLRKFFVSEIYGNPNKEILEYAMAQRLNL